MIYVPTKMTVKKHIKIIVLLIGFMVGLTAQAQPVALRTNLLYDATLSPNIAVDVRVDSAWTVGLVGGLNAWDIDKAKNKKWRHFLVGPQVRHWLNDSLWHRQFIGIDLVYSHYNVGNVKFPFGLYKEVRDHRLQGDLIALFVSYGYSWWLSSRMRLEAEVGMGMGYAWFRKYDCDHCGQDYGKDARPFLLPKLGLNLAINLGKRKVKSEE